MKRIKNMKKVLMSWLCIISLIAGHFLVAPSYSNAADVEYKELTFEDWGFGDEGTVTSTTESSQSPITSWDNVAISGNVAFGEMHGFDQDFIMFGGNTGNWKGLWMKYYVPDKMLYLGHDTIGYISIGNVDAVSGVDFRIAFTPKDSSKLEVALTVGSETETMDVNKSQMAGIDITMYATGTGYSYKLVTGTEVVYKELTLADWGFGEEGTVTSITGSSQAPITSWDNVAVSGSFVFDNYHSFDQDFIMFGGNTDNWQGLWLKYYKPDKMLYLGYDSIGYMSIGNIEAGKNVDFRIAFKAKDSDKLVVAFTVGSETTRMEINKSQLPSNDITMYATGAGFSFKSTVEKDEEPTGPSYKEVSLRSWGFDSEKATGTMWSSKRPITSWENVAVTGSVTFGENSTDAAVIRFGTNKSPETWEGIGIWYDGSSQFVLQGTGALGWPTAVIHGIAPGTTMDYRLTFTKLDSGALEVALQTGDETMTIQIESDKVENLGLDILVNAPSEQEFTFTSPAEEEPEYSEVSFADWGFTNGTASGMMWSTKTPIESWDKVLFNGSFKFNKNNTNLSVISFGADKVNNSLSGLQLQYYGAEGMLWFGGNGVTTAPAAHGIWNVEADKEYKFTITFNKLDSGRIEATLTVQDESYTVEIATYMGMDICVNAYSVETFEFGPVSTESGGEPEPFETPRKDIREYKMITFKDFGGIGEGKLENSGRYCIGLVESLDGTVFKGKITFENVADEMDGIMNIGGTSENHWYGLRVGMNSVGGLYICEAIYGQQRWDISPEKMGIKGGIEGKEVEIGLTFDCVDDHNVYVGVYVNDVFCGEKLFKDLTIEFGSRLMLYTTSSITFYDADTPWIKFLKSNVNLKYFGFSNKDWKKELKKKSA